MEEPSTPMKDGRVATSIAVAVVEQEDEFLIGRRPPGVPLAGLWEFPGGKVQHGETPAECAARECREETSIEVEVIDLLDERVYEYDHGQLCLHFFQCRPLEQAREPRAPFCWVRRRELSRYEFPPANAELLRMLLGAAEPGNSP